MRISSSKIRKFGIRANEYSKSEYISSHLAKFRSSYRATVCGLSKNFLIKDGAFDGGGGIGSVIWKELNYLARISTKLVNDRMRF